MPVRRTRASRPPRRTRRTRRTRRMVRPMRTLTRYNPRPVFTETVFGGDLLPNTGFRLQATMGVLPQIAQYQALYGKYRILKFRWILLPNFGNAEQNAATGEYGAIHQSSANTRLVYAIQDTVQPFVVPPNEATVLTMNGCRVLSGGRPLYINQRPQPQNGIDGSGFQANVSRNTFYVWTNPNVPWGHIDGFITQTVINADPNVIQASYKMYLKLTFQLSDPL